VCVMTIRDEKELGKVLQDKQDIIEMGGDLARKVLRIKATGKVAWIVASGAIAVAVVLIVSSGGVAVPASGFIGAAAVSILGLPAAISAVLIAVAAGGVGALNSLRSYEIIERSDKKLVLRSK